MKASHNGVYCGVLVVVVVVLMAEAKVSMAAVTCNPMELSPCVSSITSSTPPSGLCCTKIKAQKPCLCYYIRNPNLKRFVTSPNARKVATTCRAPIPKC